MQEIKNRLEVITGKKVVKQGNDLKCHVKELDHVDLYNLNKISTNDHLPNFKGLSIKRSGAGLTIIIQTNGGN